MMRIFGFLIAAAAVSTSALAVPPATIVISHGFTTGSKGAWVQGMAEAIIARAGEGSAYRYQGSTGVWTHVPDAGGDGTTNVVVLIFNWVPESATSVSAGPNWNYAQGAADVLYAMLRDPRYAGQNGPSSLLSNRAVQFIGHSRGACVMSDAVKRLALANIPVDQLTTHDPHPVNGSLDSPYNFDWGDPVPQKWNNVAFADNYWRADGGGIFAGLDFDGIQIANATNFLLSESALECCGYTGAHSDVHLWYHGTLDVSAAANDGEQAITTTMRNSWWTNPPTGYTNAGYFFSALGGGGALRAAQPAGISPPATPSFYNGDFEQGTYAGWTYHGGSVGGQLLVESGNGYLRIGAGVGSGGPIARHNRFFLPANASQIVLDYRVFTAAANQSLQVSLTNESGSDYVIGSVALTPAGGWITNVALPIGCIAPRSRNYTLAVQITSPGAVTAVAGIDNLRISSLAGSLPGDVNGDGFVGVDDLLAVINAWGRCPILPTPCAADIAPQPAGNSFVNVDDLLVVINNWGACP